MSMIVNRILSASRALTLVASLLVFALASAQDQPHAASSAAHAVVGANTSSQDATTVDPARSGVTPPAEGNRLDQWDLGVAQPTSDTYYPFINKAHGAVLSYRSGAPNALVWEGSGPKEWSFRKGPNTPYFAIYNKSLDKYLNSGGSQRVVEWSVIPKYEWSWTATVQERIALFNTSRNDYLISDVNNVAFGELNWKFRPIQAPEPAAEPSTYTFTVFMYPQPPNQGYLPFLGEFGGGAGNQGVLLGVNNPAVFHTDLFFIKPGHSSEQCGDDDATIHLAPGKDMTSDQIKTLWGSTKPLLKDKLIFLACAATNDSVVHAKVTFQSPS